MVKVLKKWLFILLNLRNLLWQYLKAIKNSVNFHSRSGSENRVYKYTKAGLGGPAFMVMLLLFDFHDSARAAVDELECFYV